MKKNKSFRESGRSSGGSVGFFRVLGLTIIIVAAVFIINLTSPFEKIDETTSSSETSTVATTTVITTSQTTTVTTTTTTTTEAPPPATTTTSQETTTSKPCVPTDKEMKKLIEEKDLPINPYSRVGHKRTSTKQIVVHYVANPSSTAQQNWSCFRNYAISGERAASSNFIVGLDGEIIQCMPIDEVSYHAGKNANYSSIGIEVCHPTVDGKFNKATYDSLVKLVSWLCDKYGISKDNVIRHYDVNGKDCPRYYAGEPGSDGYRRWEAFKDDLIFD